MYQGWERTNVNHGITLGMYSSRRATNHWIAKCWACPETKVTSDCTMCIIQKGIIWYYIVLQIALFALCNYT